MDYRTKAEKGMIFKVRVGSHLYGTNTPESDLDYEGIFMPDDDVIFGLGKVREVDCGVEDKDESGRNTKDAIDFKMREYREFIKLAMDNNPNILSVLFANQENIEYCNEYGERLLAMAKHFPNDSCRKRYAAYAVGQMRKMKEKPEDYDAMLRAQSALCVIFSEGANGDKREVLAVGLERAKERAGGYDQEEDIHKLFRDEGPGGCIKVGGISLNRTITLTKANNILYDNIRKASYRSKMWKEYGYDLKFAANLIQILHVGIEMARTGSIRFPLEKKELILSIKNGQFELDQIIHLGEQLKREIETMESVLPKHCNYELIHNFVIREMKTWSNREKVALECA